MKLQPRGSTRPREPVEAQLVLYLDGTAYAVAAVEGTLRQPVELTLRKLYTSQIYHVWTPDGGLTWVCECPARKQGPCKHRDGLRRVGLIEG